MLQPNSRMPTDSAPDSRAAKHAFLLDAAAREFNARGIAGASIGRIAKAMGLTRAAVYYYVKDRDELAAQCYRRSCEITAIDLDSAARAAGTGLNRLKSYIRLALNPVREPGAVLGELDYFEGRTRDGIAQAHAANVERLRGFIRAGLEDGSIRPCDDEVVAQTLVGTIAWIPLSVDWVAGTDESFRMRTVESLIDLIVNGYSSDPDYIFVPPVAINDFFPVQTNAFDRHEASAAKIEQLLRTASQHFNRRGIDGTSLDNITAELGATKGALYHYLDNKTDLVVRCHRRASVLYKAFADAAEKYGRSGLERGLIGLYLNVQAHTSGLAPLVQLAGSAALPRGRAQRNSASIARIATAVRGIRPAGSWRRQFSRRRFRCCCAAGRRCIRVAAEMAAQRRSPRPREPRARNRQPVRARSARPLIVNCEEI